MGDISSLAKRLLQVSPDALLVIDEFGCIQFSNETCSSLFGYTRDFLHGKPISILIPHRFHDRHGAHLAFYLGAPSNREMGARIRDLYARRFDGSEFPAGIRLSPFQDGGSSFVAAAVRDMTERQMISDALVAAREEADRANRAKSRFLATASHDLRQPLQAIRLINASMRRLSREDRGLSELVHHQELAIDSATQLLNALLDISRLESGAIEPQLQPVEIAAAFDALINEFEPGAVVKNLRLGFIDTRVVISSDPVLFTQLLQNIVGNAIKYTEFGCVCISLNSTDDMLVITVEDTGIGISPEKIESIFDEYYQVGPHGTKRIGVGLGLAIVREVARLLGYAVDVTSVLGKGSCFNVRVPANRRLPDAPALERIDDGTPVAPAPSTCRLVLLEDNDSVRKATELFLALEGFKVQSAASVEQAESLLAELRPGDVFITDFNLDGPLTGFDVLLQVREQQGRDVAAIVMSGDLPSMLRVVKTSLPRCRFLSKPVDTDDLLSAIAELCAA
jgi:PAS domain S-box-containing protein